jgi:hypothetical protein
VVLDLMSSWVSHLPPEVKYGKVLGHGLNAAELAKNKQMDSFFVRDLNAEPDGWALADQSVDAVVCCVRCAGCVIRRCLAARRSSSGAVWRFGK